MINAMHKETLKEIRSLQSEVIQDSPFDVIEFMKRLRKKWYDYFEKQAKKFVRWLVNKVDSLTKNKMSQDLKKSGMVIEPNYTGEEKKLIAKIIKDNVKLIKSIPQHHLRKVQDIIYEAWLRGGDRKYIVGRIEKLINKKAYPNTKRRAYLIAKDQMNKITQQLAIAEAKAYGATRGEWIHVPGEFSSRLTHIHMNGQPFDLDTGLYDEAVKKNVLPAELVYCQCQFSPIFPGME